MKHIGLSLTLVLHLLLLLALLQWNRHAVMPAAPRGELAMLWMPPLKPRPLLPVRQPRIPATRPLTLAPVPVSPAPEKKPAMVMVAPAAPVADAAPTAEPAPVLADPAALVRGISVDDGKSDLRRSIEARGGTVSGAKKEKYAAFQDAVEAATVPDCLGGNSGKHEQGKSGGAGLFALPLLAAAKLTGHCK